MIQHQFGAGPLIKLMSIFVYQDLIQYLQVWNNFIDWEGIGETSCDLSLKSLVAALSYVPQ